MPSRTATFALVALLVLAGCSGASDPETTPTSDTESPKPTATPTESPTTTAPAPEVIDYRDLPNRTQRSVRAAIENGSVLRDSDAFDGLDPRENQHVRYDGTTFALAWDTMHIRAEYGLDDVERVNASSLRPESTVVEYANLSERARRIFHRALNGSRPRMYGPDAFPRTYMEYGHVEYQGELYRLTVAHGDIPQWVLRVEPVDATPDG